MNRRPGKYSLLRCPLDTRMGESARRLLPGLRIAWFLMAAAVLFAFVSAQAQYAVPLKHEMRAVWLTTAAGLDWPTSTDPAQQQNSLRAILRTLNDAHFNTVFFQVRPRGDAYYRSLYEPWAENLTGVMGKDPGWDPLAVFIGEAHALGIEVHAWFNVFKIYSDHSPPESDLHPLRKFPQWTYSYEGEEWIDPGYPGVRQYTLNVILDLVRHYDIDGVNLDYARYPGDNVPDGRSYREYGNGMPKDEWRLKNIDDFVASVYDNIVAIKPWVKVGSSPVGVIGTSLDPATSPTLRKYSQDVPAWLRAGKQDYITPQIYWTSEPTRSTPAFGTLLERWLKWAGDRHVYAGIAAYKPEVMREVLHQIDLARDLGAEGEAFFRYSNVSASAALRKAYAYPALVPPMPWKYARESQPPPVLAVSETHPAVFQLEWRGTPDASAYVVYRSANHPPDLSDPRAIVAFFGASRTSWIDTIVVPASTTYCYALTSVNRGDDESLNAATSVGMIREAAALATLFRPTFDFQVTRVDTTTGIAWGAYRLPEEAPVTIELISQKTKTRGAPLQTLVDRRQKAGYHVVSLAAQPSDSVSVRIESREHEIERSLR